MTRDDLVTQLAAIERLLSDRIVITRVIIDPDGREVGRITRSVHRRDSHTGEPHSQGEKS